MYMTSVHPAWNLFFSETSSQTFSLKFCWAGVWLSGPKNPTQRGYDQPQPPKTQPQKSPEIPPWHPTSSWHRSFRLQPAPLDLQEPWRKRRRPKHLQRTGCVKRWPCGSTKRVVYINEGYINPVTSVFPRKMVFGVFIFSRFCWDSCHLRCSKRGCLTWWNTYMNCTFCSTSIVHQLEVQAKSDHLPSIFSSQSANWSPPPSTSLQFRWAYRNFLGIFLIFGTWNSGVMKDDSHERLEKTGATPRLGVALIGDSNQH